MCGTLASKGAKGCSTSGIVAHALRACPFTCIQLYEEWGGQENKASQWAEIASFLREAYTRVPIHKGVGLAVQFTP